MELSCKKETTSISSSRSTKWAKRFNPAALAENAIASQHANFPVNLSRIGVCKENVH
jgi:hypothetical protein